MATSVCTRSHRWDPESTPCNARRTAEESRARGAQAGATCPVYMRVRLYAVPCKRDMARNGREGLRLRSRRRDASSRRPGPVAWAAGPGPCGDPFGPSESPGRQLAPARPASLVVALGPLWRPAIPVGRPAPAVAPAGRPGATTCAAARDARSAHCVLRLRPLRRPEEAVALAHLAHCVRPRRPSRWPAAPWCQQGRKPRPVPAPSKKDPKKHRPVGRGPVCAGVGGRVGARGVPQHRPQPGPASRARSANGSGTLPRSRLLLQTSHSRLPSRSSPDIRRSAPIASCSSARLSRPVPATIKTYSPSTLRRRTLLRPSPSPTTEIGCDSTSNTLQLNVPLSPEILQIFYAARHIDSARMNSSHGRAVAMRVFQAAAALFVACTSCAPHESPPRRDPLRAPDARCPCGYLVLSNPDAGLSRLCMTSVISDGWPGGTCSPLLSTPP